MRILSSITSILSALALCLATNISAYAESGSNTELSYSKISESLLDTYGVSRDELTRLDKNQIEDDYTTSLPVLIWNAESIDHKAVELQTLQTLYQNGLGKAASDLTKLNQSIDADLSMDMVQEYIREERSISRAMYSELNESFIEKHLAGKEIVFQSRYSPVVIASLTLSDVLSLASSEDTSELDLSVNNEVLSEPLDNSVVACNAKKTRDDYGYSGYGVNIGQLESGTPDPTDAQLVALGSRFHRLPLGASSYPTNGHSTIVADVMVGSPSGTYSRGVASLSTLYSTSCASYSDNDLAAIEDLLDANVNVINLSHYFGEHNYNLTNAYSSYAKWLDHIAVDHHVTVVISSGNSDSTGVFNAAMAYNAITVGNVDDNNTPSVSDDVLRWTSSYYNGTGLAFKPDLCAPGVSIVCSAAPTGATGTSVSAPHVTGAVALLFEAKPSLMLKPEVVKSLFTAAVNPNSSKRYVPSNNNYRQYGAGLLDTYQAITSARDGEWWSASLTPSTTSKSKSFTVDSANSHVRVSLSYLKNNYIYGNLSHTLVGATYYTSLPNLNLYVYAPDGTQVASSISTYNNVEICEFTASQAGTYTFQVSAAGTLDENVKCGVSWMMW